MNLTNLKETVFKFLNLDNLIDNVAGFVEAQVALLKLEIQEDVARMVAGALVYGAMMMFAFLVLIFASLGLAHFLGEQLGAAYWGYWSVAGLYALAFIVFLAFRKPINVNFEKYLTDTIRKKKKQYGAAGNSRPRETRID